MIPSQPLTSKRSICSYCGVGCGVLVKKERNGNLSLTGDPDYPVNKGMLCSKGLNLHYTLMDQSDRLLYPMLRQHRNEALKRVSWDSALTHAAQVFSSLIQEHGPDAVGFYVSGQCLTEEYYVVNKLIKGFIGSNNIDTNSRLCMSSAVAGYKIALGEDSVPCSYEDIDLADCLFITGANPAWCHPILWRRIEAHKQANPDSTIIVADPRRTQSCALADIHLPLTPGTDILLHHALGRVLIEKNLIDLPFIINHTDGFEAYKNAVYSRTIEEYADLCGLTVEQIELVATKIGRAKGFMSFWTMGLNQSVVGVNKNVSLLNLSLITGQIGKPGSGPFSLTGQPNAMGGREVGGLSNLLPAHRELSNPEHRKEVEKFWGGTTISEKPGLTATEMFDALAQGKMKAIWIICTNPLVSLPNVNVVEEALKKAAFVIVQDISNRSETLSFADLILPAAGWGEKEGTMTNSERRISLLEKIVDAPGEALPDAEIICQFASKLGFPGFDFPNASAIFQEHCALTEGTSIDISGLSYAHLTQYKSVQWPFPKNTTDLFGTKRLFENNQFLTPNGRAQLHAPGSDLNESEQLSPEFPLILTTGRIRDQWHTRTKTGKVAKLNQHISDPFLEIHPKDAAIRGISADSLVDILNPRGHVRVRAKISDDIKEGVVFLPMHWGKTGESSLSRTNNLSSPLVDPISKEPDFKYAAVQVSLYKKPFQRIVIVGAGAGARGFIAAHRKTNTTDSITVFSKEDLPFYNRVLLPEYLNNTLAWEKLVTLSQEEEEASLVTIHKGTSIEKIDKANKQVVDSKGVLHEYDILILATGSLPSLPRSIPTLSGIVSIRKKEDIDRLKKHLRPSSHVVIIGGGLLGLEIAGALNSLLVPVTLLIRTHRLMSKQLDSLGSQLLREMLEERGITILTEEELDGCEGDGAVKSITLKSGKRLMCDTLIFAMGTTPTISLALQAGLELKKGVIVSPTLQTSDSSIYALGEIAEVNGHLYGITAAAVEQAEVLSRHLLGDCSALYSGTTGMNLLKIKGLEVCSIGVVETPTMPGYDEITFIDKSMGIYKKCVVHQDRLIGALLIGDKTEFSMFRDLISKGTELGEKRNTLLRGSSKVIALSGKLVCSCNTIGEGNLIQQINNGIHSLSELCSATGAGMGCGSCKSEVEKLLKNHLHLKDQCLVNG